MTLTVPASLPLIAAFFIGLTLVGLATGFALERWWRRRIWSVPMPAGQVAHEIRGNLVFIAVCIASLAAALHFGWARLGAESGARFTLTFVALFFGFQVFYYALHRALHTHALVRFHRHHHESRVTSALSAQSTSFGEALGWMLGYVGMPVAFSLVAPISLNGWLAYLAFNVVGNIVGHANVEIIAPSRTLWFRSQLATVFTYHALHHARWTGHYGYASTWADRLFRTEFRDWPALHARVWSGQPMASLKERGELRPGP